MGGAKYADAIKDGADADAGGPDADAEGPEADAGGTDADAGCADDDASAVEDEDVDGLDEAAVDVEVAEKKNYLRGLQGQLKCSNGHACKIS